MAWNVPTVWALAIYGALFARILIESWLRPRLIPRAEIEALADAVMRAHPDDPEEWASGEEEAAWIRSHGTERGRWRRVRKAIRRRLSGRRRPRCG